MARYHRLRSFSNGRVQCLQHLHHEAVAATGPSSSSSPPASPIDLTLSLRLEDLSAEVGERIGEFGEKIAYWRYCAAFLSTLRTNLALSAMDPPDLDASPMASIVLPNKPSNLDSNPESPDSTPILPELSTYVTTVADEKTAALRLVADSVAQRRQTAARIIIFHPYSLGLAIALLAGIVQLQYHTPADLALVVTTYSGILMALLLAVRWAIGGYINQAEGINESWLGNDKVLVARFGNTIIATVVFSTTEGSPSKRRRGRHGQIRAWTVGLRWRGRGEGREILTEAVRLLIRERGCDGVHFDELYAGAGQVLPTRFNGVFRQQQLRACAMLEQLVKRQSDGRRRS